MPEPYPLEALGLFGGVEADSLNYWKHWKAVRRNGAVGNNDHPSHAGGPGFESLRAHHFFGILREVVFINSGLLILGQVVPEVLH